MPAGADQSVVVTSAGQFSYPEQLISFASPTITQISSSACSSSSNSSLAVVNCPRSGNVVLTVSGANFGQSQATVLIGSLSCTNVVQDPVTPHTLLTCLLPSGNQLQRPVFVFQHNGDISSTPVTVRWKCATILLINLHRRSHMHSAQAVRRRTACLAFLVILVPIQALRGSKVLAQYFSCQGVDLSAIDRLRALSWR